MVVRAHRRELHEGSTRSLIDWDERDVNSYTCRARSNEVRRPGGRLNLPDGAVPLAPACPKCGRAMEAGFLGDLRNGALFLVWMTYPGKDRLTVWSEMVATNMDRVYHWKPLHRGYVPKSYRCGICRLYLLGDNASDAAPEGSAPVASQ